MTADAPDPRAKRIALLGLVVGAAVAVLAWSQVWFTFDAAVGLGTTSGESRGDTAAPAVMALALAAIAGVAGLALAGPVFRIVLGALETLVGLTTLVVAIVALSNPQGAISPDVAELTAVSGEAATATLVVPGTLVATVWPWVAVLGGAVLAAAGAWTCLTARRWPGSSKKYGARFEDESGAAAAPAAIGDDRVEQWDALSHGDDPTDGALAESAEPDDPAPGAPSDR